MIELYEQTGCSISIATPFGRLMQLLDFVASAELPYDRLPGAVFPLFNSAAGSVILATWPLAIVRALIMQCRDQLGEMADDPGCGVSAR